MYAVNQIFFLTIKKTPVMVGIQNQCSFPLYLLAVAIYEIFIFLLLITLTEGVLIYEYIHNSVNLTIALQLILE